MIKHYKVLAKGAIILFLGLLVSKTLAYLYKLILARGLGPEWYGIFSICFAIVLVAGSLSLFGFPNAIERYVAYHIKDKQKIKGILLFTLKTSLGLSLIITLILYLLAENIANLLEAPKLLEPLRIFLISIPLYAILQIYGGVSKAFKRIDYQIYSQKILYSVVNLSFAALAIYFGFGLVGIAWGYVLAVFFSAIFIFILIEKKVFSIFSRIKPVHINKEILSFSWPIVFGGVFYLIIGWTDTFMISYFLEEKLVGLYNVAIPTVGLLLIAPAVISALLLPVLSELLSENKKEAVKKIYLKINEWIFFVNFPIFLILLIFSKQILNLLFGAVYTEASVALSILAIGFFGLSLASPIVIYLQLIKKTKFYLYSISVAAIANIVLNLFLIPSYGIKGAAVASAASLSLFFLITGTYLVIKRKLPIVSVKYLTSGGLAILMAFATYFISKSLLGQVTPILLIPLLFIYVSTYAIALIYLIFGNEEKELINLTLNKIGLKFRLK